MIVRPHKRIYSLSTAGHLAEQIVEELYGDGGPALGVRAANRRRAGAPDPARISRGLRRVFRIIATGELDDRPLASHHPRFKIDAHRAARPGTAPARRAVN